MAVLKATLRDERGSRKARRMRAKGQVPGIIYGHGEEVVCVTLDDHDVNAALQHGERLLEIDLDGKTHNVLFKDVQYDAMGQHMLHVDLTRVNLDERVEVTVPIVLRGTPAGEADGGVLQQMAAEVTVECLVTAIPEDIRHQVEAMQVGDLVHTGDLTLPQGATLVGDAEAPVCSLVVVAQEEAAPAEEGEAAEPEVIGEKPAEDEEGEAAEKE